MDSAHKIQMQLNECLDKQRELEIRINRIQISFEKIVKEVMPKLDQFLSNKHSYSEANIAVEYCKAVASAPLESSVLTAAAEGDSNLLLQLLTKDLDCVRERNPQGDTALHLAAAAGHLAAVMSLLGAGASTAAPGSRRRTPLHCAAAAGHAAVARRFLDAGAQADARDADGASPLALAAVNGHAGMVALLLQHGASPEGKPQPPIVLATQKGHCDVVALLLEHGVSADSTDKDGECVAVLAAKARQWAVVKILLEKGASPTRFREPKESLLVLAAKAKNMFVLRDLLHRKAADDVGQVKLALEFAANAAVVWAFVEGNASGFNEESQKHALILAAHQGRLEILVALLETGANINGRGGKGMTSLHLTAANGHESCVRELLKRGALADLQSKDGNTPLHEACAAGKVECVKALLEGGAITDVKNKDDKTPIEVTDNRDVRQILGECMN